MNLSKPGAVDIEVAFCWPNEPPTVAGYAAPKVRFVDTRITGLTTQPIVLTDYYSQTSWPSHHNFTVELIFEPHLEPDLTAETLAKLEAANIHLIHRKLGFVEPVVNAPRLDHPLGKL